MKKTTTPEDYPCLHSFSKAMRIEPENLITAYHIEREFHEEILKTKSYEERKPLYENVYKKVHSLYKKTSISANFTEKKHKIVKLFAKELTGKSILDVGCGDGAFLYSVSKLLKYKKLLGLDVSLPEHTENLKNISFIRSDVIKFQTTEKFDVIFSSHVLEHIAPDDLDCHIRSLVESLNENGTLIIIMPNPLFGPSDVTRILDFSYSGKIQSQGTHLNELTHTELINLLSNNGFNCFKTIIPFHKIRYQFGSFRISTKTLEFIENNKTILNLLHKIKFRNQCIARFDTTIICKKK